jgi:hypothetical protein
MEDRRDFLKKLTGVVGSTALLTTTAGKVWAKPNVFADSCVCEKCGYDFRLKFEEFKPAEAFWVIQTWDLSVEPRTLQGPPQGTVCPKCGHWHVYKEFTSSSC